MAKLWKKDDSIVRYERYRFMLDFIVELYEYAPNSHYCQTMPVQYECYIQKEPYGIKNMMFGLGFDGETWEEFVEIVKANADEDAQIYMDQFCGPEEIEDYCTLKWAMKHEAYAVLDLLEDSIQE